MNMKQIEISDTIGLTEYLLKKDEITGKMFRRLSPELQARIMPGILKSIYAQKNNARKSKESYPRLDVSPIREIITDAHARKFYFEEV
jgi:hypothetical protein